LGSVAEVRTVFTTIKPAQIQKLMEGGIVFVEGEMKVGNRVEKGVAAIYETDVLASGTAKEWESALKPLIGKRGKGLANAIDNIVSSPKYWKKYTFDDLMNGKLPCFVAGTLVRTENGLKPMEKITVGEKVLSRNMNTNENEWKVVTETFTNYADQFVVLEFENESVKATGQHTFWLPKANKWTKAIDLKVGDSVLDVSNELKTISNIYIETKNAPTYNFEVESNHNYFVGQNQVLTHNKARVSKFADNTLLNVEFYRLLDINNQDLYIGQTIQGKDKRLGQHIYEGNNPLKKSKAWKKAITGINNVKNFPKKVAINAFEAAVIELYEIQLLRSQGGVVFNSEKPIGLKKFNKFKNMGNPCRLFK